jgi:pilus assembly protein CpaB
MNRSWVLLAVALVVGGVSAFGVKRFIDHQVEEVESRSKAKKTVKVLVPKQDLPKGAVLSAAAVAVRQVPADWAHSNALGPDEFARVDGQRLAYPVSAGEMLMWSLLEGERAPSFSARLPNGARAITVPVDEVNSISGLLQPGDRIDLMVSAKREGKVFMFPLMQNVSVLATGSLAVPPSNWDGREATKRTYATITLEASPEDARKVLAAREVGKLAAMLRAPDDKTLTSEARTDAMSLLGIGGADQAALEDEGVPVLYGGQGQVKVQKNLPRGHGNAAAATSVATPVDLDSKP